MACEPSRLVHIYIRSSASDGEALLVIPTGSPFPHGLREEEWKVFGVMEAREHMLADLDQQGYLLHRLND